MTEDLSPDAFVDDVAADRRGDRALLYEAESPDEPTLVQAAKAYGFGLKSRRDDSIAVQLPGGCDRTVAYPLLQVLPFDSGELTASRVGRVLIYYFFRFTFFLFWYQLFNGWSASVCIKQFYLFFYNLIFTSTPIIVVAILDHSKPIPICTTTAVRAR